MAVAPFQVEVPNELRAPQVQGDWWDALVPTPHNTTPALQPTQTPIGRPIIARPLYERLGSRPPKSPFLGQIDLATQDGARLTLYTDFTLSQAGSQTAVWSNQGEKPCTAVQLTINRPAQTFELRFQYYRPPTNAHEYFLTLRLDWFLSQPLVITVEDRATGITLFQGNWQSKNPAATNPNWLLIFADLDKIQRWTGQPILIGPNQELSESDLAQIAKLHGILHFGGFKTTWSQHEMNMPMETARRMLDVFANGHSTELKATGPAKETLFGRVLSLGRIQYTFQQVRLANEPEIREQLARAGDAGTWIKVRIIPGEDTTVVGEYLDRPPYSTEDWGAPQSPVEITLGPERQLTEAESAPFAELAHQAQAARVAQLEVDLSPDTQQFIAAHPFLRPILQEAAVAVARFVPGATLRYDLFDNPEEGGDRKLVLVVATVGESEAAADQYYRFVQEWWVAQAPRVRDATLVTVA